MDDDHEEPEIRSPSHAATRRASLAAMALLAGGCRAGPATMSPSLPGASPAMTEEARVESVTDGDTVVVSGGVRVRLIGMDTPETRHPDQGVECFGLEASTRAAELLEGEPVRLVYDIDRTDRYGRTLAYVYRSSDDLFVNAALVREGYARARSYPPNVAHDADFQRLEAEAQTARRGLWTACGGGENP